MLPLVALYLFLRYLRGTSTKLKLVVLLALTIGYGFLWLYGSEASPLHEIFENSRPSDL